jgi:hypothetical protein
MMDLEGLVYFDGIEFVNLFSSITNKMQGYTTCQAVLLPVATGISTAWQVPDAVYTVLSS